MNMHAMLMIMIWNVNACLTPRGVTGYKHPPPDPCLPQHTSDTEAAGGRGKPVNPAGERRSPGNHPLATVGKSREEDSLLVGTKFL
jgi:hypothetical protein